MLQSDANLKLADGVSPEKTVAPTRFHPHVEPRKLAFQGAGFLKRSYISGSGENNLLGSTSQAGAEKSTTAEGSSSTMERMPGDSGAPAGRWEKDSC
jgi:hypothetical protein